MRPGLGFLTAGVVIIIIGIVWLIVGGPGSATITHGFTPAPVAPLQPTPATVTPGSTTILPTTTVSPSLPTTLTPSQDAIRLHLMDIAFGEDNVLLQRWDPMRNNGRIILSVNGGNSGDLQNIAAAVHQFNTISATNQISENIKQNSQGDLNIRFVPESGMADLALNATSGNTLKEVTVDGVPAAKIVPGSVYLNVNLKGDVRNHTLLRSLFYTLGAVGGSDTYPDSLFYSGANTNANLTYIDQKALELLYGKRLQPGMTAGEVKNILSLK